MKPSIGRIVHFVGGGLIHHAAIITEVFPDGHVDVEVFGNVTQRFRHGLLENAEGSESGTWHWPERVD